MKSRMFKIVLTMMVLLGGFAALNTSASAYSNSVSFRGQGFTYDGTTWIINQELCGVANGADVDGPYLLWVLTATGANNANITGPWGTAPMTKTGNGTFKYISGWYQPSALIGAVSATYDGKVKNAQLVVSHGCAPAILGAAWCSPGYWRNTLNFSPNGWTTIGVDPLTTMFNGNVSPAFYANDLSTDQLLTYVLNHPTDFGGQLGTAPPYDLTAFNATGAYLTSLIPGYYFEPSLVGNDEACPLDAHGNFK
jgi:hypothetical protein